MALAASLTISQGAMVVGMGGPDEPPPSLNEAILAISMGHVPSRARYHESPGRQSQLIGAARSNSGEVGVGSTRM
jgi:hypothetical protein